MPPPCRVEAWCRGEGGVSISAVCSASALGKNLVFRSASLSERLGFRLRPETEQVIDGLSFRLQPNQKERRCQSRR